MIRTTLNADLQPLTTFGLPARCGQLVQFTEADDLRQLYDKGLLKKALVLGGGSNMLFVNGKFNGTVLQPTGCAYCVRCLPSGEAEINVQAAMPLDELCRITTEVGLWGLENLSGIPGTVGGAAVQNAGAYGAELADVVAAVEEYHANERVGRLVRHGRSACRYGYRTSVFKEPSRRRHGWDTHVVTRVALRLSFRPRPRLDYAGLRDALADVRPDRLTPGAVRRAVLDIRASKLPDPKVAGSAGSFFQNPVVTPEQLKAIGEVCPGEAVPFHTLPDGSAKLSAAWLIDRAGCKEMTAGGVALWPRQPLVIVNVTGKAVGADVAALEGMVVGQVRQVFGVTLVPEVVHVG